MRDNQFKCFIPFTIEKGKNDASGEEELKIKGLVSTMSEDADGDILVPSGFDIEPFKNQGYFTWAHSKSPADVIGEPTNAYIKNNEFRVEGKLYKSSDRAKQVYQLAETLAKDTSTRRLGFSLEGTALERDPLNPKRVIRSEIHNVTVCLLPKNSDAYVEIHKGYCPDKVEYEILEKGDKKFLCEVEGNDGNSFYIDEKFNITLEKSLGAGSVTGREATGAAAVGGAALKKESLEGSDDDEKDEKKQVKKNLLKKSQVYETIFSNFGAINLEQARALYVIVDNYQQNMENLTASEALVKALEVLGIDKDKADLFKSKDGDNKAGNYELAMGMCKAMDDDGESEDEIKKAMSDSDIDDDTVEKAWSDYKGQKEAALKKAKDEEEAEKKKKEELSSKEDDDEDDEVKEAKAKSFMKKGIAAGKLKSELKAELLTKGYVAEIVEKVAAQVKDANEEKIEKEQALIKGISESNEKLDNLIKAFTTKDAASTTLIKGLVEELSNVKQELEVIKRQAPAPKSVSGYKPSNKEEDLNKGRSADPAGVVTYNIDNPTDLLTVSQYLDTKSFNYQNDPVALKYLEISAELEAQKTLSKGHANFLLQNDKMNLVKGR